MTRFVAITGGIGSGKSVVSRLLRMMGYRVYDTDSGAKRLMNESTELIEKIKQHFGDDVYKDGLLDSARLGSIVFKDEEAITALNAMVHPAVTADVIAWAGSGDDEMVFFETALLYVSGLDQIVDAILKIEAPMPVRVERVIRRSGLTAAQVKERIVSQQSELRDNEKDVVIINDGVMPVIPQLERALSRLK